MAAVGFAAPAGTELVAFPEGFATEFVRYEVADRHDCNIARFMYINRAAWEAARPGALAELRAVVPR